MNGTVSSVAWLTVLTDPGLGIASLVLAVNDAWARLVLSRRTDGGKISVAPDGHLIHPVFRMGT